MLAGRAGAAEGLSEEGGDDKEVIELGEGTTVGRAAGSAGAVVAVRTLPFTFSRRAVATGCGARRGRRRPRNQRYA